MRKRIRVVLASVCAFALVGAFALAGCSSNTEQQAGETQKFVSHSHALTERIATRVVDLAMR